MTHTAVYIRKAWKQYGKGKNAAVILRGLNMNVFRGSIYGLLGSSGCGKTTLLNSIVGRRRLDSGEIKVLGEDMNHESKIGSHLGYMPQEIGLLEELTLFETAQYFGWIQGMTDEQVKNRYDFLSDLIQLSDPDRLVKDLSGGQQRRVSFMAALIQDPELIILDEPTVGLDPVLRQNIWDYMVKITAEYNRTVIITTHYIEEARQANQIGLMRNGVLLAESSPDILLTKFNCTNLEEAFLMLSRNQESGNEALLQIAGEGNFANLTANMNLSETSNQVSVGKYPIEAIKHSRSSVQILKSLIMKCYYQIIRNVGGLIFILTFVVVQMLTMGMAIGGDPEGLLFGIVNEEMSNRSCQDLQQPFTKKMYGGDCELKAVSCLFLEKIGNFWVKMVPYRDRETAYRDAKKGKTEGYIVIPSGFSEAMTQRLYFPQLINNETVERSEMKVWISTPDFIVTLMLKRRIYSLFEEFNMELGRMCNESELVGRIPVRFGEPVYGKSDPQYAFTVMPCAYLTLMFFQMCSLTSTIFVTERNDGLWERNRVIGVKSWQSLTAHTVIQIVCSIVNNLQLMFLLFIVFRYPLVGNGFTLFFIGFMQGLVGIFYGFLISIAVDRVSVSNYLAVGSIQPVIMLSGTLWPIEGIPMYLRWACYLNSVTVPSISVRSLMQKNWGITHPAIYNGILTSFGFLLFYIFACVVALRRFKL